MRRRRFPLFVAGRVLHLLGVLLFGLLLAMPALASPPEPPLWKVSGHGNSMYLLGSFHMLRPGDHPLARPAQAAFDTATEVVFELAPEEATSPTLALTMLQAAQRRGAGTLEQDLGPALWARLQAHARGGGLAPAQLSGFEPWFLGIMLSVTELQRHGFEPALGLDRRLMEAAARAGKRTGGLETAAEQIHALSGMELAVQVQMLEQTLDQIETGPELLEGMYSAWRRGDAEQLWQQMGADLQREHPQLYRRINVVRNEAWLPQIERRLREGQGDVLVVVGALHLLGEDGLAERLRAKGYRVERVCGACAAP